MYHKARYPTTDSTQRLKTRMNQIRDFEQFIIKPRPPDNAVIPPQTPVPLQDLHTSEALRRREGKRAGEKMFSVTGTDV